MTLLRYNRNFDELGNSSFSSMLDRFFNESVRGTAVAQFTPQVDIAETEKHFEIELAVPGLKKEDIKINLEEGNGRGAHSMYPAGFWKRAEKRPFV